MRRSTDRQLRRSLSPAIISLGPCRRIRESFVLQHRATSPLIHQHHGRTSCVVLLCGSRVGSRALNPCRKALPHVLTDVLPTSLRSVSPSLGLTALSRLSGVGRSMMPGPRPASAHRLSTPSPFERKPSSSGTGSRFGGVCRCGRPQCLRVRLMATFSLTIPGLIRGSVCDVWPLWLASAHRLRASFRA